MKVPRKCVIALLEKYNCDHLGNRKDKDVWVTQPPHNLTIRIPASGSVPLAIIEIICLETLNMGMWEFDYWLGENKIM